MTITSTAFQDGESIPSEYTCDGDNYHPPLTFSEIPIDAESLVLIVDDPDAPGGTFTHWLVYDMTPATMQILANTKPETGHQGTNDFGDQQYGGPAPPQGSHRYFFRLYALNNRPHLAPGVHRRQVDEVLQNHVIAEAELMGTYARQNQRIAAM